MLIKFLAIVVVIWLVLMPPLFTDGACTAEFDRETARMTADQKSFATPSQAVEYWNARQIPVSVMSAKQCRMARDKFVEVCSAGDLIYAVIPVQNKICRLYRDDSIKIKLQYDDRNRLTRMLSDMKPFQSLPLPWFGVTIYWGR